MVSDMYDNLIFQDSDILQMLYSGEVEFLPKIIANPSVDVGQLANISEVDIKTSDKLYYSRTKREYDVDNQSQWFMPPEYYNFDVYNYCLEKCYTDNARIRVLEELKLYEQYNLITLLQMLKYVIDTLRTNNILWGVGRGSSVASYVLFLLDVHRIDSLKYELPITEFFR